ncbi:hypothetical protein GCM10010433_18490 [Streptomyces pulveraceus]
MAYGSSGSNEWDGRLCRCNTRLRGEGVGLRLQALAAAAKKKQPETHDATRLAEGRLMRPSRISMRDRAQETPNSDRSLHFVNPDRNQ